MIVAVDVDVDVGVIVGLGVAASTVPVLARELALPTIAKFINP